MFRWRITGIGSAQPVAPSPIATAFRLSWWRYSSATDSSGAANGITTTPCISNIGLSLLSSQSAVRQLSAHDLFRKPVPTFRDHALIPHHDDAIGARLAAPGLAWTAEHLAHLGA